MDPPHPRQGHEKPAGVLLPLPMIPSHAPRHTNTHQHKSCHNVPQAFVMYTDKLPALAEAKAEDAKKDEGTPAAAPVEAAPAAAAP